MNQKDFLNWTINSLN